MELKEVLDRATERPWEILRTGGPDETIMGDYMVGISSAHNESLVVDPTWFPNLPAVQRCVVEPILTVHGKFNAIIVAHAVNNFEGMRDALRRSEVILASLNGKVSRETWNSLYDDSRMIREVIRQAEEVSP